MRRGLGNTGENKTKRNLRALQIPASSKIGTPPHEIVIEGQNRYVPRKSVQVGRPVSIDMSTQYSFLIDTANQKLH